MPMITTTITLDSDDVALLLAGLMEIREKLVKHTPVTPARAQSAERATLLMARLYRARNRLAGKGRTE